MSISWNQSLPASFCEGKLHPYLVPHVYEFFSSISGAILIFIGILGILQPRMEMIMKMTYSGIIISGFGTMMMHWRRIAVFDKADTYPLLITLAFGLTAFFDTMISLLRARRIRSPGSGSPNSSIGSLSQISLSSDAKLLLPTNQTRERLILALEAILYTICIGYLAAGLILLIYSSFQSVFGVYFGVPYGVFAIGGSLFLHFNNPEKSAPVFRKMGPLLAASIGFGLLAILFKCLDSFACNPVTVWFLPHALFHIFVTYSAHCFIVFLAFHREYFVGSSLYKKPDIFWKFYIFPVVVIPERAYSEYSGVLRKAPSDVCLSTLEAQQQQQPQTTPTASGDNLVQS